MALDHRTITHNYAYNVCSWWHWRNGTRRPLPSSPEEHAVRIHCSYLGHSDSFNAQAVQEHCTFVKNVSTGFQWRPIYLCWFCVIFELPVGARQSVIWFKGFSLTSGGGAGRTESEITYEKWILTCKGAIIIGSKVLAQQNIATETFSLRQSRRGMGWASYLSAC